MKVGDKVRLKHIPKDLRYDVKLGDIGMVSETEHHGDYSIGVKWYDTEPAMSHKPDELEIVKVKIGLDIHGVIDHFPNFFSEMTEKLAYNAEIHIITGQEAEKVISKLEIFNITYHKLFSIVDYHREAKDTEMWQDSNKTWWMNEKEWLASKGMYIAKEHIDIHFDDTLEYAQYIPSFCTFILVPKYCYSFEIFARTLTPFLK